MLSTWNLKDCRKQQIFSSCPATKFSKIFFQFQLRGNQISNTHCNNWIQFAKSNNDKWWMLQKEKKLKKWQVIANWIMRRVVDCKNSERKIRWTAKFVFWLLCPWNRALKKIVKKKNFYSRRWSWCCPDQMDKARNTPLWRVSKQGEMWNRKKKRIESTNPEWCCPVWTVKLDAWSICTHSVLSVFICLCVLLSWIFSAKIHFVATKLAMEKFKQ